MDQFNFIQPFFALIQPFSDLFNRFLIYSTVFANNSTIFQFIQPFSIIIQPFPKSPAHNTLNTKKTATHTVAGSFLY